MLDKSQRTYSEICKCFVYYHIYNALLTLTFLVLQINFDALLQVQMLHIRSIRILRFMSRLFILCWFV